MDLISSVLVSDGHIALALHLPSGTARVPCVLCCHGLSASKDSDKYLLLAEELTSAGLAVARFDFRGCGESTGREDETTIATRLEDAAAALAWLSEHPRLDHRRGLLGSSLGGYVALHLAAARSDIRAVVTWNAPAELSELAARNLHDSPGLGQPFFAEYRTGRYAKAPRGVPRHLVVHGDADDVVPLAHGRALHAQASEPRELLIIAGGDHRLTDPVHRREAVARSLDWFLLGL